MSAAIGRIKEMLLALCTGASYDWGNVTLFCIVSSSCWRMKYALMGQVTLGAKFPGPMQYGASWVPPTPAGMCYSSPQFHRAHLQEQRYN